LKVIRIIQFSSFLKTIVLSLLSLCEATPKHLDLSRLLSIESCGVLNPPSFHSNSFAKLESDTHPASKAPSQSTSIINWLGWECHTTSSLIPSYLSLFILFYHIRNHISFVFAFVFRIITCIPSYRPSDHIFDRSIKLPSTILPSLISSLQHLVSELKLLNQVHSILASFILFAFVFPFINQKKKLFFAFLCSLFIINWKPIKSWDRRRPVV